MTDTIDRRDMGHAWARDLLRQCRRDDVAFYFKQSSGRQPETGTSLTVKNDEFGVFEQREIRELPDLRTSTRRVREKEVTA